MNVEVLIIGAGPTGLMLANQLGRRGVATMIIDRHSGPAQETRAVAVQARSLEIYSKLGIVGRALELGARGSGANLWAEGRRTARVPIGDIGQSLSPFPFVLMLGQDDNEEIMGEHLRHWGLKVEWNTELVSFTQHAERVTARLRAPDGTTREVNAAYLAGCDGARSAVREQSGISFPGAPYEHVFFVADTVATGPMVPGEVNVYLWREGFHLLFPLRGNDHWRIVGILPQVLRERQDLRFDDVVPAIRQEAGSALAIKECGWFSTYRIHHRCAERFRDRRVFLLGDAAHIHSPAGGQGMNTGLQDAYNLAWKLALVLRSRADGALLDSFEMERRPVAQRLLRTTDRAFRLVVSESWIAGIMRTRVLGRIAAFAMTRERVRTLAFRTVSQIGIRYRKSALSVTLPGLPQHAPRGGDRFPWLKLKLRADGPVVDLFDALDDTRFNLLVVGQAAPVDPAPGLGEQLQTHVIPPNEHNKRELARAGIPALAFYLIRPDGYVGLAGARLAVPALRQYLGERCIRAEAGR